MWPLAGGAEHYLDTLGWILRQCSAGNRSITSVAHLYRQQYGLNERVATQQVEMLRKFGLVDVGVKRCTPSNEAVRWMESGRSEIVIGTIHANIRFIGELLQELRHPQSREQLRLVANDAFGFRWQGVNPIGFRLNWLRSGGLAERFAGGNYRVTEAGLAFLELVVLQRPTTVSVPLPDEPPPESVAETAQEDAGEAGEFDADDGRGPKPSVPGTKLLRSARDLASEIGERLVSLSCDGSKHQDFEVAVRDAFEFLGFEAEHLSGPGQTDVLLTATHADGLDGKNPSPNWRYRVTVDSKAATGGRLISNQVNWPALEKHRKQHDAQFSLLVGPGPAGQLLQFAADQAVGVLDASALSALCEAHASAPLATSAYFALFADSDGNARGGLIDTSVVESARAEMVLRRQLMVQAFEAVESIAPSFKPPDAGLVHYNLSRENSGQQISEALIAEALELLATPWLSAIAPVSDGNGSARYVPAAPGHEVAQRLRWLADAFDEAADDESESSVAS